MGMQDKKELLGKLEPETVERIARHFQDGAFVFDLDADEYTVAEGNTVYHVVPCFAEPGAESVVNKLRRIMEREWEENK